MTKRAQSLGALKKAETIAKQKEQLNLALSNWKKQSKSYISSKIINKNKAKIIFVIGTRGTGKTTMSIFESFKYWSDHKIPSVFLRRTYDEMRDFATSLKSQYDSDFYPNVLGSKKSILINGKGVFKMSATKGGYKSFGAIPIINFSNINQLRRRTSIAFPNKIHWLISDEITNYSAGDFSYKTLIDYFQCWETILRGKDADKIVCFLNNNFEQELLWNILKVEKEYKALQWGKIRRFKKQIDLFGHKSTMHFSIYKYKSKSLLNDKYESSEFIKFAQGISEFGDFIQGSSSLVKQPKFKQIKQLGDYRFNIIFEFGGDKFNWIEKVGIWQTKSGIMQVCKRWNKTGKTYYFSIPAYQPGAIEGNEEFYADVIDALRSDSIEFENLYLMKNFLDVIKAKFKKEEYHY